MKRLIILSSVLIFSLLAILFHKSGTKPDTPDHTEDSGTTPSTRDDSRPSDPETDLAAGDLSQSIYMLCGIDSYGRTFQPVSGLDETRDVGMFYFLWHGDSSKTTYNNEEILKTDPETFWNPDIRTNEFHYWGEPLYGYYSSWDRWVVTRHIEMFLAADIDYLVIDMTNVYAYKSAYTTLFNVLEQFRNAGWDVPKVTFYTNSSSELVMKNLYNDIYSKNRWKELWYCPSGEKPMIIGKLDGSAKGDTAFLDFFDLRASQWPNEDYRADGIPWMEWTYPQPIHSGFVNVSVAQHVNLPFSDSILNRKLNWGRGYNQNTKQNVEADSRRGTNFQSQWDTVLARRDQIQNVFVTGWNEWVAQKLKINGKVWFVDCAVEEFSRDIEPMKGGYEDSFYLQLCDNIRRLKATSGDIKKPAQKTIDLTAPLTQWNSVRTSYMALTQHSVSRTSSSVDGKIQYKKSAPRNNIQQIKLANDSSYLYLMIRCANEMTGVNDADFMNLYLGIGDLELKGWNGYKFVLSCGDRTLYALDSKGNRTKVADVAVTLSGYSLQASVSLSALHASGAEGLYFKLCDQFTSTDIMDTYDEGKCLPMGRLSYYYYFG